MALISTATQAQLNQAAANIAQNIQANILNGVYEDVYNMINDLAAAVNCLTQYNANNSTASINLPNQYVNNVGLSNVAISTRQR